MIWTDVVVVLKVYLITVLIQVASLPTTRILFQSLVDYGYPMARLVTTLAISLIVWEVGNLGVGINTGWGLGVAALVVTVLNYRVWNKAGRKTLVDRQSLRLIVIEEYLFLVGFVGMILVRSYNPAIDSLEKFMDFGFTNRYLSSTHLPVVDMWFAGETINYYSFGHFWSSVVIRLFGVTPAVGYNLVLAFIGGLSLSIAFSVTHLLSGVRGRLAGLVAGLVGAMGVVMAGNTHVIWYWIKNRGLDGYWYASATRFIHNTIHEFPGYSFVVADLHGHLIDLPVVLMFLAVFITWVKSGRVVEEIVMGLLLGVMAMTNTWDVLIYGLLVGLAYMGKMILRQYNWTELVRSSGVIFLVAILTAGLWLSGFQSISEGLRLVAERSPLWQLAVLWSGGALVCLLLWLFTKGEGVDLAARLMIICTLLLIAIPEFVYVKDIYPDHPRANTMFKLTYQASILIGLMLGCLSGRVWEIKNKSVWKGMLIVVVGGLFVGTMIFPAESFPNYYGNFDKYQGLDGERWLRERNLERYKVVEYLRDHRDDKNMVEAVGDSYSEFNLISVYSSVPTIQGWRVHEWLWRGGYGPVAAREAEVRQIYEDGNGEKVKGLLDKYNVGWIVVGEDERKLYKVNELEIMNLGEKVHSFGQTYLIKVKI